MSPADVPGGLLLDYRLDSGVAVVTVTGEVERIHQPLTPGWPAPGHQR